MKELTSRQKNLITKWFYKSRKECLGKQLIYKLTNADDLTLAQWDILYEALYQNVNRFIKDLYSKELAKILLKEV